MTYICALRARLVFAHKFISLCLIMLFNFIVVTNAIANANIPINAKQHLSLCDLINSRSLYDFNSSSMKVANQIRHQSHIVKTQSFDKQYQLQQQKQKMIDQRLKEINQQLSKIEISR